MRETKFFIQSTNYTRDKMFRKFSLFLSFFVCLLRKRIVSWFAFLKSKIIVSTSAGFLEGSQESFGSQFKYFAFKGIPYAEPPIGELRFRNPVPHRGWSGVRNATVFGKSCLGEGYFGMMKGESEDCLYLNVYSPNVHGNLPVMFWIHGGGFRIGDGSSLVYGPKLLVREDVVIVTINYRLSVFGFLSTEDKHAQGNYGLKDMVLALKWVKQNIKNFGGDPDNITAFGTSSGAASVHLMLMSKMSQGLFHKAIMMSGTALFPLALQPNPKNVAEALGHKLGLKFNTTKSLVEQLRQIDGKEIIDASTGLKVANSNPQVPLNFLPSVEPEDSIDERFLVNTPINFLRSGNFHTVPTILGTNSNEGLLALSSFASLNEDFKFDQFFVPLTFGLEKDSDEAKEVIETFKKLYFGGEIVSKCSKTSRTCWANFHTDAQMKFSSDRTAKFLANENLQPVYSFEFGYSGSLSILKTLLSLEHYEGAMHGDESFYIFCPDCPLLVSKTDRALEVRRRQIRMFTNFAKFG
jgi:bile salt-stimulated lipase